MVMTCSVRMCVVVVMCVCDGDVVVRCYFACVSVCLVVCVRVCVYVRYIWDYYSYPSFSSAYIYTHTKETVIIIMQYLTTYIY